MNVTVEKELQYTSVELVARFAGAELPAATRIPGRDRDR